MYLGLIDYTLQKVYFFNISGSVLKLLEVFQISGGCEAYTK